MNCRIRCSTSFDITVTGIRNNYHPDRIPFVTKTGQQLTSHIAWSRARNQQRNWETINQVISLRCLPENITDAVAQDHVWRFEFDVLDLAAISSLEEPLGYLRADAHQVPMITGLDEQSPQLEYLQPGTNIWFDIIKS